jgi:hypothetical protein
MAAISKEFLDAIKKADLYSRDDAGDLSKLSKERRLRNGKGYSTNHIRNFLLYHFTAPDDVINMIVDFYNVRKEAKDKLKEKSQSLLEKLQEENA